MMDTYPPMKRYKRHESSPMDSLPDDIMRCIMDFCEPDRYLTTGVVNKQMNSICRERKDTMTSTMGFLESDTPLVNDMGEFVLPGPNTMDVLSSSSHLHVLIPRAIERGATWDHFCVEQAVASRNIDFFRWISDSKLFWVPSNAYCAAAERGDLDMMKFMVESGYGIPDERAYAEAFSRGYIHILDWLKVLVSSNHHALATAVQEDDVGKVVDMYDFNTNHYDWILHDAIYSGSTNVVEYLLDYGLEPDELDFQIAKEMYRTDIFWMLKG